MKPPIKWQIKLLEDLVQFSSGGTPSKSKSEFWKGVIPWISAATMHQQEITTSNLHVSKDGLKAGSISSELDGGITSNAISCLSVDESKLLKDFLWFQFSDSNFYKKVGHIMDGTGQKELSSKQILKLQIILPSIDEQQQITNTLSVAQQEIKLLKQLAKKYKTQKRGLMQKILTGIWRIKPEIIKQYEEV